MGLFSFKFIFLVLPTLRAAPPLLRWVVPQTASVPQTVAVKAINRDAVRFRIFFIRGLYLCCSLVICCSYVVLGYMNNAPYVQDVTKLAIFAIWATAFPNFMLAQFRNYLNFVCTLRMCNRMGCVFLCQIVLILAVCSFDSRIFDVNRGICVFETFLKRLLENIIS